MTLNAPPEDWLRSLNRKFRECDIHVRRRPFLALDQYCKDFGLVAVAFDSTPAKTIFDWFTANTKAGTHQIGSLFTGVFYYDSCFWPVDVFIGGGQLQLNAVDSLQAMTDPMKSELMSRPETAWPYVLTWANSVDIDSERGQFFGKRLGKICYPGFSRTISTSRHKSCNA